jgi:hypothetical protein
LNLFPFAASGLCALALNFEWIDPAKAPTAADDSTVGGDALGGSEGHASKLGWGRPPVKTDARVRRCILESQGRSSSTEAGTAP